VAGKLAREDDLEAVVAHRTALFESARSSVAPVPAGRREG